MKTIKRIFELTCAAAVVAAEHLCQCAKCSCNFDKSKAKSSDAGCECPNCGTLLDEKGAAKVEDQAAKEKANDGKEIVAAKDARKLRGELKAASVARQSKNAALEASVVGAGYSLNDLNTEVREAVLKLPELLKAPASQQSNVCSPCGQPWVCDVIAPAHEAGETWQAVVQGNDGLLYQVEFTLAADGVKINGTPKQVERKTDYDFVSQIVTQAKNATRQPALEAGGPGSGPHPGQYTATTGSADELKLRQEEARQSVKAAYYSSGHADARNTPGTHRVAEASHSNASNAYMRLGASQRKAGDEAGAKASEDEAKEHGKIAFQHGNKAAGFHTLDGASATTPPSLQAGYNGNQHQSSKELAAEHSVAADTASKVAASASKAARNQDPSNKEGMHDHALTMHAAAKSLHELAAQKHRSAGDEDGAADHDTAAAGHGNEMQAHKGVIEACGGMAARGNGAAGLEAGGPGSGRHKSGFEKQYNTMYGVGKAKYVVNHHDGEKTHPDGSPFFDIHISKNKVDHENFVKSLDDSGYKKQGFGGNIESSDATPAAGLQLDCSACVEAKNFKSVLNPIADGIIMYMPSGTHTITPSQNGRPVTVSVAIDASAAEKLESQRQQLEASGKKPFFSVQHSTQIAAFWPAEFFWDTRLDATGSLVEGVWARGEWTRAGREAVEGKDFRTFSPTFFVDAIRNDPNRPVQVVCNDEAKANMGALENDPAFQTISPLWAHDASAAGTPKPKPEGVTTEKLIVMVHDELRASNPDLQDVVNALSFKYDMRVSSNDVARALRGEALEAGGPGSGPHPGYAAAKETAEAKSKTAKDNSWNNFSKEAGGKEGTADEHHAAGNLHGEAARSHRDAAFAAKGDNETMKSHFAAAKFHDKEAGYHYDKADEISSRTK